MEPSTKAQKECIWLISGEVRKYEDVEKALNITREEIREWLVKYRSYSKQIAAIRRIYISKNIKTSLKDFYSWYSKRSINKACEYCGISETEIQELLKSKKLNTKRSRGPKLELDRKDPDLKYDDLNNLVFACYWCNNAKTDTFTHSEFKEIGRVISKIWKSRLDHDTKPKNK
jgi:hypothetical protein